MIDELECSRFVGGFGFCCWILLLDGLVVCFWVLRFGVGVLTFVVLGFRRVDII